MPQPEQTALVFEHCVEIPAEAALNVWRAWCALSGWPQWDASLRGIVAEADGLHLGKRFAVVPKAAPTPIAVNVTAYEEGRHFTTSSVNPMGILAFGHSLSTDASTGRANLTHSICAVPTSDTQLPEPLWARLKSDVVESVNALAATTEAEQVPA